MGPNVIMSEAVAYEIILALGITKQAEKVEIIMEARRPVQVKVTYSEWNADGTKKLKRIFRKYCICNKP